MSSCCSLSFSVFKAKVQYIISALCHLCPSTEWISDVIKSKMAAYRKFQLVWKLVDLILLLTIANPNLIPIFEIHIDLMIHLKTFLLVL